MDEKMARLSICAVALAAMVSLGGCGSRENPTSEEMKSGGGFSAAVLMGRDTPSVHSYKETQVTECMRDSGFSYQPVAFKEFVVPDTRAVREKAGFGFSDPDLYTRLTEQITNRDGVQESTGDEQQGFQTALSACKHEADENLAALIDQFSQTLSPDDQQRLEAVRNFDTPEFDAATKAWSTCMTASGYEFASQVVMYQYASSTFTDPSALPDEIKLAVVDWDCSQTDDVAGVAADAFAKLDAQLNDAFEKLLQSQST